MITQKELKILIERIAIMFEFTESGLSLLSSVEIGNLKEKDIVGFCIGLIKIQEDLKKELLTVVERIKKEKEELEGEGGNE